MSNLYTAIESGDLNLFRTVVSNDTASVNRSEPGQLSPLAHAIRDMDRSYDLIEFLVKSGADVNWKTVDGYSPLHLNIDMNGPSGWGELPCLVAKLLKAHGANVEARNHYDWTPLMRAALEGTSDEFEALLAIGADFSVTYTEKSMPPFTRGRSIGAVVLARSEKTALLLKYGLSPSEDWIRSADAAIAQAKDPDSRYVADIKVSRALIVSARAS